MFVELISDGLEVRGRPETIQHQIRNGINRVYMRYIWVIHEYTMYCSYIYIYGQTQKDILPKCTFDFIITRIWFQSGLIYSVYNLLYFEGDRNRPECDAGPTLK